MDESTTGVVGTYIGGNRDLTVLPSGQPGQVCVCDHHYEDHFITFGGDPGCQANVWDELGLRPCLCDGFVRE